MSLKIFMYMEKT